MQIEFAIDELALVIVWQRDAEHTSKTNFGFHGNSTLQLRKRLLHDVKPKPCSLGHVRSFVKHIENVFQVLLAYAYAIVRKLKLNLLVC